MQNTGSPRTFLTSVAVSHADCKWLAQLSLIMQTISMDREHFSIQGNS